MVTAKVPAWTSGATANNQLAFVIFTTLPLCVETRQAGRTASGSDQGMRHQETDGLQVQADETTMLPAASHRFMRSLCLLMLTASNMVAADPQFGTSSVSLGADVAVPAGGYRTTAFHTGPAFAGEYEFRLHKFVGATIGAENYLLSVDQFGKFPLPATRERVTLMPFGLRGIVPFGDGRGELFAGTGGAALWTSDYTLGSSFERDKVLWHLNGGFRISLDRRQRFHVGPTVRHYRDLGRPTEQWVSLTAEFSYRFGR
jgi:hypothetical protein